MSKTTPAFKRAIEKYLKERSEEDILFAQTLLKENKNIDDCCTYILNEVQKSGINGFTDAEVYSMAVHYYDEDNIEVGKPIDCHVVVNHQVELTEEEKIEAKEKAIKQVQEEAYRAMHKKATPVKPEAKPVFIQTSMF